MPTSNLSVAPFVINLVETVDPHDHVLDVGPGWGKYATLLREYLNRKPTTIDALEAWRPYIEDHDLPLLYDSVYLGAAGGDGGWIRFAEAGQLVEAVYALEVLRQYDMVLMVDVIEHMTRPQAHHFLRMIPQARVVICTPVEFFSNGPGLPPTEEHVSHWQAEDWHGFRRQVEWLGQEHGAWLCRLGPER